MATMAPAITESLNAAPSKKLSSSANAGKIKPSNSKHNSTATSSDTSEKNQLETTSSSSKKAGSRDRRSRTSPAAATAVTTRVTRRSKDPLQGNNAKDDQMGLKSAKTPSVRLQTPLEDANNCENQKLSAPELPQKQSPASANNSSVKNKASSNTSKKDTSTEQLIADLTTDFEEAITAEICLRKQLLDVKVTSPDTVASAKTDLLTPSSLASGSVGTRDSASVSGTVKKPLMDSDSKHATSNTTNVNKEALCSKETQPQQPLAKTSTIRTRSKAESPLQVEEIAVQRTAALDAEIDDHPLDKVNEAPRSGEGLHPTQLAPSISAVGEDDIVDLDAIEEHLRQLDGGGISSAATLKTPPHSNATSGDLFTSNSPLKRCDARPSSAAAVVSHSNALPNLQTAQSPQQLQQQQNLLPPNVSPQTTGALMRDVGNTSAELEDQDIEEVLKALKGFDSNTAAADNMLGDLNSFFNDVYTSLNCEEMVVSGGNGSGVQQTNITATANPSAAVASTSTVALTPLNKAASPLKELQHDIEKKQQTMQRKIDFLLRRLKKLQMRYMAKHASEEIAGLFEWTTRLLSKGSASRIAQSGSATSGGAETLALALLSSRPAPTTWAAEVHSTIPTAHLVTTLRRLESAANAQQLNNSKNNGTMATSMGASASLYASVLTPPTQRKSKKAQEMLMNSAASNAAGGIEVEQQKRNQIVPNFDAALSDELMHISGMQRAELREVQTAIDSDATESSSGGESADEMVSYNNQLQQSLSIAKRAAWRYSRDRAAIASRWSWLLSQIADLEIKIRQHSQLYQEVRRTKGRVMCEEELKNVDGSTESKSAETGELDVYQSNRMDSKEAECLEGSCRTRGFALEHFRKRKLLQTTNIHTILKKAARPSSIKCGCQWPLNSCALCTGRADPTAPRDLPDTMILTDRVALLDSGYHSVLSFKEDIHDSIHFEAISRMPDWQHRVIRSQPKSIARSVWKAEREANYAYNSSMNSGSYGKRYHHGSSSNLDRTLSHKRKYIKRKDKEKFKSDGEASKSANSSANSPAIVMKGDTANATATATAQTEAAGLYGNGTAILSSTSSTATSTPLVANKKIMPNASVAVNGKKKMHVHLVGDGVLLEPPSANMSSQSNCDYPQQRNTNQFNHSQIPSSSISSIRSSKARRSNNVNIYTQNQNYNQQNNNNSNSFNNTNFQNTNGDINFESFGSGGGIDSSFCRSRTSSPTHTYYRHERSLERRNRSSYDIDNIVIPYSVAAATRVEILPYKEIPTPKWRILAESQGEVNLSDTKQTTENNICSTEESAPQLEKPPPDETENTVKASEALLNVIKPEPLEVTESLNLSEASEGSVQKHDNIDSKENGMLCNNNNTDLINPNPDLSKTTNTNEILAESLISEDTMDAAETARFNEKSMQAQSNEFESEWGILAMDNDATRYSENPDEVEDISDEALLIRHERALVEERKKFQTYLKFPWSTRSRANRRIDSRAESSGANTPDPASPAPNTPPTFGGDQESIPSPMAPSTPLTPLETINEINDGSTSVNATIHSASAASASCTLQTPPIFPPTSISASINSQRRRTISVKKEVLERDRRSSTPDLRELGPITYEPLRFPLSDEVYQSLLNSMYVGDDTKDLGENHKTRISSTTRFNSGFSKINGRTDLPRSSNSSTISAADAMAVTLSYEQSSKKRRRTVNNNLNNNACDSKSGRNFYHVTANEDDDLEASNDESVILQNKKPRFSAEGASGLRRRRRGGRRTAVKDHASEQGFTPGGSRSTSNLNGDDPNDNPHQNDDEEDDGYPKHHLAPPLDMDDLDLDDGCGGSSMLGVSDTESSDEDPFRADDDNDPEWKRGNASNERGVRKRY